MSHFATDGNRAASGDLLRAVLEQSADPVFVKNRDGEYIFYNQAAATSVGRPVHEVIGRTDAVIFDEVASSEFTESDRRVLDTGVPHTIEEWVTANGVTRCYLVTKTPYLDGDGQIVGLIGISRDITERKLVEERLRDSERCLAQAQRIAHVGSWENDLVTDRVSWSDEIYRIFGLEPGERQLTVAEFRRHVHPDDLAIQLDATAQAQRGDARYEAQFRIVRPDGQVRVVHSSGEVVRDDTGRPVRAFGAVQDVTDRIALEEQFQQAHKMEAVGRLAGGVAHDFNNFLTVISSSTAMVLDTLVPSDPRREELEEVQKAARSAARLTQQLLAFSRREVVQPKLVRLEDAVAAAESLLRRLIGDGVHLTVSLSPRPSTVHIDPGQLEQIFTNLAANARDAMPGGGELLFSTSVAEASADELRRRGLGGEGAFAVLSVRDSGVGMDERTRARIFEPFFTTKEEGRGTGLGLATVYAIARRSGGFVTVESAPGQGATFEVHLPLAGRPSA
jgi:two-component system cell cycle sensor histidine kinase/response regulator CckA